jgi:hypothetical protein
VSVRLNTSILFLSLFLTLSLPLTPFPLFKGKLPFDDDNIRRLLDKVKSGVFMMPQVRDREERERERMGVGEGERGESEKRERERKRKKRREKEKRRKGNAKPFLLQYLHRDIRDLITRMLVVDPLYDTQKTLPSSLLFLRLCF